MIQMIAQTQTQLTKWLRGIGGRQVRLACGVVMFAHQLSSKSRTLPDD